MIPKLAFRRFAMIRSATRLRLLPVACAVLAALLAAGTPATAAARYDPALRFRTLTTAHFVIYFHQGEEAVARRFAPMAEQVYATLTARLLTGPAGRTHVILVDQDDTANGWANPLPRNTIELRVVPIAARTAGGNTDDWLRVLFTHEFTHILQLDRSRGYASIVRHVFGRSPISFPNIYLPLWQIEGLATYAESATTGRGRVNAGDFRLLVSEASRQNVALPLDRATADVDNWPDGNTPYAWGAFFHEYLAGRFGERRVAELSERTAGRFYFLSSPAFKEMFGESLGSLWKDFVRASATASGTANTGRRLTTGGFEVLAPRFANLGGAGPVIVYSSRNADDFPALMAVDLEGHSRRLASRNWGDETGVSGDAAVFDQIDLDRSVAERSDLFLLHFASRRVERLTTDGRFVDPAVSPDGRALACVRLRDGERILAVFDLPDGAWPRDVARLRRTLAAEPRFELSVPGDEYASPRWSADGRSLAVSRIVRNGPSQIVVVDGPSGTVTELVSSQGSRNVTPVWMPDGQTILFASDRGGGPFNLYAVDVKKTGPGTVEAGEMRQVTAFATGAAYPDVSPDGRLVAYVGYTAAGNDVFVLPLEKRTGYGFGVAGSEGEHFLHDAGALTPDKVPGSLSDAPRKVTASFSGADVDPSLAPAYRPWPTLLPRYWIPAFDFSDEQVKLGAQTSGGDVLGRHLYSMTALYRVAGTAGAPGSPRYDWAAGYTYDRWVPAFFADASDRTHFLRTVQLGEGGGVVASDLREQSAEAGVSVPDFHVRWQQAVTVSVNFERQTLNVGGLARASADRDALRLAWSLNSAKVYAYSISPEQGVTIGATGELVRTALGADANANASTLDLRAYVRLGGRHAVLACRAAGGAAWGDERTARIFYLGGPGPNASPADFGSDALNLLRGFDQNQFPGSRIAVGNLEYRLPLVRVERGLGTWPAFLRTLHAAAFFDLGKTWTPALSAQAFAWSVGAEAAANVRVAYRLPLTLAAGVAWPHDPAGFMRPAVAYVRLGRAF